MKLDDLIAKWLKEHAEKLAAALHMPLKKAFEPQQHPALPPDALLHLLHGRLLAADGGQPLQPCLSAQSPGCGHRVSGQNADHKTVRSISRRSGTVQRNRPISPLHRMPPRLKPWTPCSAGSRARSSSRASAKQPAGPMTGRLLFYHFTVLLPPASYSTRPARIAGYTPHPPGYPLPRSSARSVPASKPGAYAGPDNR